MSRSAARPLTRAAVLWLCGLCVLASGTARCADDLLPQPPELQPDVDFWIRVYSEISTSEGFIHDQRNLAVVYQKLRFDPDTPPGERQAQVDELRGKYQHLLEYLATGGSPRDAEEQRVRDLWAPTTTTVRLAQAANEVRFQLGQADRFRAGLERAGRWQPHIARTLTAAGLPPELAVLPQVESSFNPEAFSKAGAAGLWQFMRDTGRRFMRVDTVVDERLDPYRATEAAAQLLSYNYRMLGTWPLAITAYNYGADGMRRARDALNTVDIVRIVREYSAPVFGFASRNFYVSFLAAVAIDRNRDRYFTGLMPQQEAPTQEVPLLSAIPVGAVEQALGITRAELRMLNPALREPVWSGARPIPVGYRLRVPLGAQPLTSEALAARVAAGGGNDAAVMTVTDDNTIRIAADETLGHYADWLELPTAALRSLNQLAMDAPVRLGQLIRLDFTRVAREQFETRRRAYHQAIETAFFATRRVVATDSYVTRRGDTLFSLTQKSPHVPVWLLQRYNPDVDLLQLRAGTQLVLPRIEARPDV